ncbi:11538_t:CDS:2 [Paraglomus brasilianum]|uniref:11538_t:CDS:1 n=1 Tax=Paraglomus brasilianum TaxID=144538 RepID=A0A9N8VTF5_9GLOM|nr:11538_t:CDS:2 [Paraglomus brasilianum]
MEPYTGNEIVLKYFETYDEETWTYEHFLNELKEAIVISPSYTNDWSGLDGACIKGGFWVVVILFGVVRFRGFAVVFGTQDEINEPRMKSFFQDIILEREKRNAGKNYVIEGVRVLNEARFRSSDETENGPSQTPEDKVAEVTDDEEWEFDTPQPSWLKKVIEEHCLSKNPQQTQ